MASSSRFVSATALALSAGSSMAFVAPPSAAPSQEKAVSASLRANAAPQHSSAVPAASAWGLTATAATAAAAAAVAAGAVQRRSRGQLAARRVTGVCWPLTEKFDPLNLGNTDAKMDRYTAVEIKHGRISMIAVVGYIMPEVFRFPGCEDFKNGLGALESIPLEGWIQLVALIGAHEVLVKPRAGGMGIYDFGTGTELLEGIPAEELERKQTVERNNGRLAMVAILGLMWQDGTFGESPIASLAKNGFWGGDMEWFVKDIPVCHGILAQGICAQKERSSRTVMRGMNEKTPFIENEVFPEQAEMEMSPAVPFLRYPKVLKGWVGGEKGFDPLGVTDALPVYFVREAELKHGRVCMLATIGWIATDLGARFPGEKFQAVTSSLEAHNKMVEGGYMLPFLGAIGVFELYGLWLIFEGWPGNIKRDAGDFFIGKGFLPKDAEKEKDMRMKELENGRLAMFAFSGIVTQAVITGKTWPFFD